MIHQYYLFYIDLWPFYCVFSTPAKHWRELYKMPYLYFIGFHNKKRPKRPSNWTFFFKKFDLEAVSPWAFFPLSGNTAVATPVNFLDGIFGYTSRSALHWYRYQICVVPFRAVKTGLSHGLNSKPSTYRPVNQLITLMGEMNQNIIHSKNNIGSTLSRPNNVASAVSEWFLEWFWCCELLCLRLLFIVPIYFIRWCIFISLQSKFSSGPKKKIPAPRENYPVPDTTRFLDPGPDRSPV